MGPGDACVFCEIVRGASPAHVVYEDEHAVAFLDLFPFTRGHLLVVPKRHVDRLTDLRSTEYVPFLTALSAVCKRVERLTSDYNVALNQGPLAGQIVFHLHFHVIPRYDGTDPFRVRPRVKLSDSDAESVVGTLRPA